MAENILSLETKREETPGQILNTAIRLRTKAISFDKYEKFLQNALCHHEKGTEKNTKSSHSECYEKKEAAMQALRNGERPADNLFQFKGVHSYDLLKTATELFLILQGCGIKPYINPDIQYVKSSPPVITNRAPNVDEKSDKIEPDKENENINTRDERLLGKEWKEEQERLGWIASNEHEFFQMVHDKVQDYFRTGLPYFDKILINLHLSGQLKSIFCDDQGKALQSKVDCPCMLELIWSYWHEEGMLTQALNAISLRFQNRKTAPKDPLANLTLNPLRPLSNLIWGYVQDEQNRLSLHRRAYEYDHEYGLSLIGKAVPALQTSDSRSKFIEAFHNLLNNCMTFYKEENNKLMIPDPFPLLNAVKEVHLLLAEGAHNQFGDLPFQARVEMLMQQWLLARPEMHEFLGRRPMMPYAEGWMSAVDSIKSLQGWTDVSAMHFRDLGVFGEQIILSIRYGDWNNVNNAEEARNWALYWRSEIQSYAHAYRIATGVDLANPVVNGKVDATKPSVHLSRRLEMQLQRR